MKSIVPIAKFKEGETIQGFYLCKEKHIKYTRSGDLFLDIVILDSTGSIKGKLWDYAEQFQNKFHHKVY